MPEVKHYLVNERYEDPGIFLQVENTGDYILFDIGNIYKLDRSLIKKINKIFITHTHMDHFIGFDYLLRLKLGKQQIIEIFGIYPVAENIYHKLQGYIWNLVEFEPQIIFLVKQYKDKYFYHYRFDIKKKFKKEFIKRTKAKNNTIYENENYKVNFAVLDHKILILGYSFVFPNKLKLNKELIKKLPLKGKEIGKLKEFLENPKNCKKKLKIKNKYYSYDFLKERYTFTKKGIKISYITDVLGSKENIEKIIKLVKNSDYLYCESVFLEKDIEQASKVYHLTTKQTAEIAKLANVRNLVPFHFSRRYGKNTKLIFNELSKFLEDTDIKIY